MRPYERPSSAHAYRLSPRAEAHTFQPTPTSVGVSRHARSPPRSAYAPALMKVAMAHEAFPLLEAMGGRRLAATMAACQCTGVGGAASSPPSLHGRAGFEAARRNNWQPLRE